MRALTRKCAHYVKYPSHAKYCTSPTYIYPSKKDEYGSHSLYPLMENEDLLSEEEREVRKWYDKMKKQVTVEEKQFVLNMPRYWGWKCFMIHEEVIPFNNLKFAQHMTRTHLIETASLPSIYNKFEKKSSSLLSEIKNTIVDAIEYQLDVRRNVVTKQKESIEVEKEITKYIVGELNRVVTNSLLPEEDHLKFAQVDVTPRIEASWRIESLVETVYKEEYKQGIPENELPEEYLNRPSDKYIQYIGHPILQLRHCDPLPQIMEMAEANIFGYSVPVYEYDPYTALGYQMARRHITNIPGFWPGDDREFSFLSYHYSNHIKHRPPTYGVEDAKEALQCQAIFASFGWLTPVAWYQGFSTFHDVTYPLVTQTILTDGQEFTFAVYQLNTSALYHKDPLENSKCNICWITPTMSLYEVCEEGKLKGVNEDVLNMLLQFYLNKPKAVPDYQLKPYLGDKIKHVADYEDAEKREWLESNFKHFTSNRPKHRLDEMYEVYDWERIFKIWYRQRPREARKRPFEKRENPYLKSMPEHPKEYIPRHLRPDKNLPKWKQQKYKSRFYPE